MNASGPITILGIDAATQPNKLGLSRGRLHDCTLTIDAVTRGADVDSLLETLARWAQGPTLLAIDAPLGWPAALGRGLSTHRAGQPLRAEPNHLFRRQTDRFVHAALGKLPLEVGADRIARTAEAALRMLGQLRVRLGAEIPLLWTPTLDSVGAIEVYPAATLIARGIDASGYKGTKDGSLAARQRIATRLAEEARIDVPSETLTSSDDCLDAALCVLAGGDFLASRSIAPRLEQRDAAELEGWIWFGSPRCE